MIRSSQVGKGGWQEDGQQGVLSPSPFGELVRRVETDVHNESNGSPSLICAVSVGEQS